MKLAGNQYVVCTVRHEGLARQTADGGDAQCRSEPDGQCAVAIDSIGAGCGEWVLLVSGSSARRTHTAPLRSICA